MISSDYQQHLPATEAIIFQLLPRMFALFISHEAISRDQAGGAAKTSVLVSFLMLLFLAMLPAGCGDAVTDYRDNEFDPGGMNFRPAIPENVSVSLYHYSDDPLIINDVIEIIWEDASDFEAGYLIERRTADGEYQTVSQLPPNATRYMDTLQVAGVYHYRITAVNEEGEGNGVEKEFHLSPLISGPEMDSAIFLSDVRNALALDSIRVAIYSINIGESKILDLRTGKWVSVSSMPFVLRQAKIIRMDDGRLMSVSGSVISEYSLTTQRWEERKKLNIPSVRNAFQASVDEILIIAGDPLEFWMYSLSDRSIRKIDGPPNTARPSMYLSATLLNNGALLFPAGSKQDSGNSNRALLYHPANDEWSYTSSMLQPNNEVFHTFTLSDGRALVVFSPGHDVWATPHIPEVYDPGSDTWMKTNFPGRATTNVFMLNDGNIVSANPYGSPHGRISTVTFDPGTGEWAEPVLVPFSLYSQHGFRVIPLLDNTALWIRDQNRTTYLYRKAGNDPGW
jgi:hypothetical protein